MASGRDAPSDLASSSTDGGAQTQALARAQAETAQVRAESEKAQAQVQIEAARKLAQAQAQADRKLAQVLAEAERKQEGAQAQAESKRSIASIERELEARKREEADTLVSIGSLCAAGCGGPGISRCSGCSREVYCSKQCQKSMWPKHKGSCKVAASSTEHKGSKVASSSTSYVITATHLKSNKKVSRITFTHERGRVKFSATSYDRNLQRMMISLKGYNTAEGSSDLDFLSHVSMIFGLSVVKNFEATWRLLRDDTTELVAARANPDDIERFLRNDWGLPQLF